MNCTPRALSVISLVFALGATGALALAVATDYWLWTSEVLQIDPEFSTNLTDNFVIWVHAHSGLWRICLVQDSFEDEGENTSENVPLCTPIDLGQEWSRIPGADTTLSILRAMRKAIPVLCASLLVLVIALGVSIVGNAQGTFKTMAAAVLFIFSALGLASGVIVYISAVNVEVSHRKSLGPNGTKTFKYKYGWAFFFAGAAFVATMAAAVANITLYLSKFTQLDKMTLIIPGLEKQAVKAGVRMLRGSEQEELTE